MAQTYTSAYRVWVPPFAADGAARRSGVRLREDMAPLDGLADFAVLYLPQQLRAQAAEEEQQRRSDTQRMIGSASGDEMSSSGTASTGGDDAFLSADALLNGDLSTKSRHAIKHSFYPMRGTDNSTIFTVRNKHAAAAAAAATARQSSRPPPRHTGQLSTEDAAAAAASVDEEGNPLLVSGVPWWMRTEAAGALLPRSSTKDAYRGIASDSFLLDQQHFHSYFDVPPTPALNGSSGSTNSRSRRSANNQSETAAQHTRRQAIEHLVSAASSHPRTERLRKLPLFSSEQPSLFFRLPHPQAHPQLYRREARHARQQRQQQIQQQPGSVKEEEEKTNAFSGSVTQRASTSNYGRAARHMSSANARPSTSSPSGGALTARAPPTRPSVPSPPQQTQGSFTARANTPAAAASAASAAQETTMPATSFRAHMQAARARWAAEQAQREMEAQHS